MFIVGAMLKLRGLWMLLPQNKPGSDLAFHLTNVYPCDHTCAMLHSVLFVFF